MKSFFTAILFLVSLAVYSQPITVSTAQTPQQLVNNVLLSFGVDAFNITINGSSVLAHTSLGNVAQLDRKSTRLNSSHSRASRMPSSA